MPSRVTNIFGAYDLFAKSIPGTAFLFGVVSLLPQGSISPPETGSSALLLGVFIVILFILGFIFGQALHSVAVGIENTIYSGGKWVYDKSELFHPHYSKENTGEPNPGWWSRRYGGIIDWAYFLLVPHRLLFKRELEEEYDERDEPRLKYQIFSARVGDLFQPGSFPGKEEYDEVYDLVMSHLEFIQLGRARQFQAIFSFCRSTWVTLVSFVGVYGLVVIYPADWAFPPLDYPPIVIEYLPPENALPFVILCMALSSVLFMMGERQYKRNFIKYVSADFVTSTHNNLQPDTKE